VSRALCIIVLQCQVSEAEERNLVLEQNQNIFIFFAYRCMYFIMQNSRSLKEAFDYTSQKDNASWPLGQTFVALLVMRH